MRPAPRLRLATAAAVAAATAVGAAATGAAAQPAPLPSTAFDNSALYVPDLRHVLPAAEEPEGVSTTLRILVLMTVLTLVPSILVMTTAFPRIIIVLGLLRQAMGTPQLPPGQVLLGLALFLTMLVMSPTWHQIHAQAVAPYFDGAAGMTQRQAIDISLRYLRQFMFNQIQSNDNDEDVYLFLEYALGRPIHPAESVALEPDPADPAVVVVPTTVLIPAFMLSELKTAFIMGFRIYLPFLVIDMVISSILISMGMMMLPPVLISLPFKILLFVLADGWHLVVQSLLLSFAT